MEAVFDWLISSVLAAVSAVSASPAPAVQDDVIPPAPAPVVWVDPTTGVEVDAESWTPPAVTYPTGDYWNDECIPSERFPGFGTTLVGAMPCTP